MAENASQSVRIRIPLVPKKDSAQVRKKPAKTILANPMFEVVAFKLTSDNFVKIRSLLKINPC